MEQTLNKMVSLLQNLQEKVDLISQHLSVRTSDASSLFRDIQTEIEQLKNADAKTTHEIQGIAARVSTVETTTSQIQETIQSQARQITRIDENTQNELATIKNKIVQQYQVYNEKMASLHEHINQVIEDKLSGIREALQSIITLIDSKKTIDASELKQIRQQLANIYQQTEVSAPTTPFKKDMYMPKG